MVDSRHASCVLMQEIVFLLDKWNQARQLVNYQLILFFA